MRTTVKRERAFTLIEVIVAMVVVAILASIAYPSYMESVRKAKRAEGRAALMQLMQQEERYFTQNNTYIAFSSASTDAAEKMFRWYSGATPATSAYEITAQACSADVLQNCVVLTAKPGTAKVDGKFEDTVCGELSLDSRGTLGAAAAECWK